MNRMVGKTLLIAGILMLLTASSDAQGDARVTAKIDARKITVGDQVRLFLEAQNNPATSRLQWAVIPDSFNNLEVVEKGKIDTVKQGDVVTYRQRLIVTGFDSGVFKIPSFVFSVIPNSGTPYTLGSDSFELLVQTVAVDTSKAFKPIKGIVFVKSTWLDYIWYILAGLVLVGLAVWGTLYYLRKRNKGEPRPQGPQESLHDYTLRLLNELDARQLWQKKQVKDYYVELTDIVRNYIEARFQTPALELTTDEMLSKVQMHRELAPYYELLAGILHMADLAKFAKAEPLPQEHIEALENARKFVSTSRPIENDPIEKPTQQDKQ